MSPNVRDTTAFVGFFIHIFSIVVFVSYVTWSFVPKAALSMLGLGYLPSREWAVLLPTYLMMLIFVVYVGHMLSMMILSPLLGSEALTSDTHGRQIQEIDCDESGRMDLQRLYDIPPSLADRVLFNH